MMNQNKTLQFANILAAKQHYQKEQLALQQKRSMLESVAGNTLQKIAQQLNLSKWKKVVQLAISKARKIAVVRKIYNKERHIVECVDSTAYFSELWLITLIMYQSLQKADDAISDLALKMQMDNERTVALSACIASNAIYDQMLADGSTLRTSLLNVAGEPLFQREQCAIAQTALFKTLLTYQLVGGSTKELDLNIVPKNDIAEIMATIFVLFAEPLSNGVEQTQLFELDILNAMYLAFNRNARKLWSYDKVFSNIKDLEQYAITASIFLFGMPCIDGQLLWQFEETDQIRVFTDSIMQNQNIFQ